jgi:DNA-binding NtrC family response regulator
VVDDLGSQREIASQILKRLRYTVVTAASGEDALEFLRYNSCDLVLLDMIMEPGMDGLDTYRQVIEIHPGQRAVIASGFAENERVGEALSLGVSQYIRKPYTIENLGLAIATALARQRP